MVGLLGLWFSLQIWIEIILFNILILALAIFGFRNMKRYRADLMEQLKKIRDKRKEL